MLVIPELTIELLNKLNRNVNEDIVYFEDEKSKEPDYCLFYYVDKDNNVVYAYNRHLVTGETINKYKYKDTCGCLFLFCDTTKYFKFPKSFKLKSNLANKTWYTYVNPLYKKE